MRARVEVALIGITEEALRGRIRAVMLHAARTDEWKRRQGWILFQGVAITNAIAFYAAQAWYSTDPCR
jgi:uncharacterized membrane protein